MPAELPRLTEPNDTPLVLAPNVAEFLGKRLGYVAMTHNALVDALKNANEVPLTHDQVKQLLNSFSANAQLMGQHIGVPLVSDAERDELQAALRRANEQIEKLEAKLGAASTPELACKALCRYTKLLKTWWRHEGFGYIRDLHYLDNGMLAATLSLSGNGRFDDFLDLAPAPLEVAKQEWRKGMEDKGLVVVELDRQLHTLDVDKSRKALTQMLADAFPSVRIRSTQSTSNSRSKAENVKAGYPADTMQIGSVTILIRELKDVENLATRAYMTQKEMENS